MTGLHISATMDLPIDAVTSTFGILAKKGAGKSNAGVVMAEEMYDAGVPWVAVDPKGDWWGMRSSADGLSAGIPLIVFGGRHGDIPLEATAGSMLADLVLANRLTCILDVSEFSKADLTRFLTAFGDRLYRQATDEPLHIFLEEAHEYLPQMVRNDEARCVAIWQKIVKWGRTKGLGVTLISQRSASLNKDALTQIDTLITLRIMSPQDRAAVKAWVDVHESSAEMMHDLPSLADGQAYLWSPEFLGILDKIQFRRRRTFDSGATPKVGEVRRKPSTLADIDLSAIREAMAATISKAEAADPKHLRAEIRKLEQELHRVTAESARVMLVQQDELRRVSAEARDPSIDTRLAENLTAVHYQLGRLNKIVEELITDVNLRLDPSGATAISVEMRGDFPDNLAVVDSQMVAKLGFSIARDRAQTPPADVPRASPARSAPERREPTIVADRPDAALSKAERALLNVLLQYGGGRTRVQLALMSKYSHKSSTFANALGGLRSKGYVDKAGDPIKATDAAFGVINVEPLPTGPELLTYWLDTLDKAQRILLQVMLDEWPKSIDRDVLAERSGYSAASSTFANALGRLRSLDLVKGLTVSDWFAEEVRA